MKSRAADQERTEITGEGLMPQAIPRRDFLGGMTGLMAAIAAGGCASMTGPATSSTAQAVPRFAYVGCYTTKERDGHGEGINLYRIDPGSATGRTFSS